MDRQWLLSDAAAPTRFSSPQVRGEAIIHAARIDPRIGPFSRTIKSGVWDGHSRTASVAIVVRPWVRIARSSRQEAECQTAPILVGKLLGLALVAIGFGFFSFFESIRLVSAYRMPTPRLVLSKSI
jgi:hypothetical protein